MKVYLTTIDPETFEDLEVILDLLKKDAGPIVFKLLEVDFRSNYIEEYQSLKRLNPDNITSICNQIKSENGIYEEYIVLITNKGLDIPVPKNLLGKDWNSAFLHRNIAVNSSRWDKLTEDRSYLAVAHQIIENLFQSFSHLKINSQKLIKDVHTEPKGCINDYCKNFEQTYSKILSGYICNPCQDRALNTVGELYISQVKKMLTRIRNRLTDNYDFKAKRNVFIEINKYGDIKFDVNKIDFKGSTLVKHAYLFYIINYNKSISSKDFKDNDEVKEKFKNLSDITGVHIGNYEVQSFARGITTHQSRAGRYIQNSLPDENVANIFKYKTHKDENNDHHYMLNFDENVIKLDPSLQRFRLN